MSLHMFHFLSVAVAYKPQASWGFVEELILFFRLLMDLCEKNYYKIV